MTQLDADAIDVIYGARRWCVIEGDNLDVLDRIPTSSIDAVVTDPPAAIGFMGLEFDSDLGGAEPWINWLRIRLREAYRVLKPGGHALVWALPRTSHWTGRALEEAGFEIRDCITHLFGSGFPKSLTISKEIERRAGALEAARAWEGWGSALKPCAERWFLCRKKFVANSAPEFSTSSRVDCSADACGIAQWLAAVRAGLTSPEASEAMATSSALEAARTIWSTVESWSGTLAAVCDLMSTSTIATGSAPITELQILRFLTSQITPDTITRDPTKASESTSSVELVASAFDALRAWCDCIPTHAVRGNASTDLASCQPSASAEQRQRSAIGTVPSCENWWLVRKPPDGPIAKNVLQHGTGALNIDGCRVPHVSAADFDAHAAGVAAIKERGGMNQGWCLASDLSGAADASPLGRWPAHLVLSHSQGCQRIGVRKVKAAPAWNDNRSPSMFTGAETSPVHHADDDGTEVIESWRCVEGCPVLLLDEQSGITAPGGSASGSMGYHGGGLSTDTRQRPQDEGGAARFFTQLPFDDSALEYEQRMEGTAWASGDRSHGAQTDATSPRRDICAESSAEDCDSSTMPSGKRTTDQSRGDSRSTIATKIAEITGSKISSSWTPPPTSDCTADASCAPGSGGSHVGTVERSSQSTPSIGTYQEKDGRSTDDAGGATAPASNAPGTIDAPPFGYFPKTSTEDRERGCEHLPAQNLTGRKEGSAGAESPRAGAGRKGTRRNVHSTVKSTALMRWLVRLITPPNGVVLDMFAGSGSTGVACSAERMRFIGIELSPEYAAIARARVIGDAPLLNIGGGL